MMEKINLTNLKKLNIEQLNALAAAIRQEIITVVSKNGGHLASNLGVVELTIAIHKVFDSPKDKVIFDVSHQSYTHKILTGRLNEFKTLRKFKGLSSFTRYQESCHDAFEAGHSSTAISAGLGYLEAKKNLPNEIGEVVAVVGDASIVNGLSLEALTYLSNHQDQKMIIILNDNEMGISPNVSNIINSHDNHNLFTSLGFKYISNIDGHNLEALIKELELAKSFKKSLVLDVKTKKGKGYKPAEDDIDGIWHGVGPFDLTTGKLKEDGNLISMGELIGNYLINYVSSHKKGSLMRVITPAMTLGSGLLNFAKACPEQFIDVGLAEENAALMAASMAHAGLISILFCYASFLQRAYDEIIHDIARCQEHVIICVDHAGIVSGDGDTHQGIFDLSYLSSVPNLTILAPHDGSEALAMVRYAIEEVTGPVIIRYSKEKILPNVTSYKFVPKWEKIGSGKKAIITYGILYQEVKDAFLDKLEKVMIINACQISPLDEEMLLKLPQITSEIVVYEEVYQNGGLGDAIIRFYNEKQIVMKIKVLALKATYLEIGTREELLNAYHISLADLKKVIGDSDATKLAS